MEREREHRGHSLLFFGVFLFCFGNQPYGGSVYELVFPRILPGRGSEVAHVRKAERRSDGKRGDSQPAVGKQAYFQELL